MKNTAFAYNNKPTFIVPPFAAHCPYYPVKYFAGLNKTFSSYSLVFFYQNI
jgi:hypothetical protein